LQRLKKNTILTVGIIGVSLFILLCSTFRTYARTYETQFFTIRLNNKLNYSQLKHMGIHKIIYPVFKDDEADGGLYFTNTRFRTLEPALEQLIKEFDFQQLQLCAWMIGRSFKWIGNPLVLDCQYESGNRRVVRKLDIFNPDVIHKIITVFKELASHKINCILIQDDLNFKYNEGFSNWGKASFTITTGNPAKEELMMQKDTPYNLNWNRVKINQLNKVLKLIVQNCKMVNSGIKVGINIYYETPIHINRAEAWYSHNLSEILETGVDYIYLMSYHRQIKDEMKLSESRNRDFFKKLVEKAYQICKDKLVVKLQIRDWNTSERIPAHEVKAYLNLIPSQVERVCFIPVKPGDFDYLEEIIGVSTKHTKNSKRKITDNKSLVTNKFQITMYKITNKEVSCIPVLNSGGENKNSKGYEQR
jgi:hypothetical protein